MDAPYLLSNITELEAPIGKYIITDGNVNLTFSVSKNYHDYPFVVQSGDNQVTIGEIQPVFVYDLILEVAPLEVGKTYQVSFIPGGLEFSDSGQYTIGYSVTRDGWVAGLGAYDPNDREDYLRTGPQEYIIEPSSDGTGFSFKLIDKSRKRMYFTAAWVKIEQFSQNVYEEAIGMWIT